MLKMTLLFSIVLFAFTTSSAEPLDEFIQNAMKEYRVPGASIAIVRDGKVTELKGYGVRTAGRPEKVDPDTIFSLASLTKPFTAVLVAGLVEDGKLGWTRRLSQDFPQIRLAEAYPTAEVTVRDLLVHRSGLPAFQGDFFDVLGYERDEVIERIVAADSGRFDALDYGKKIVHDEGGETLSELLEDLVKLELSTARHLFTLLFLLRTDLPGQVVRYHRRHL